MDSIYKPHNLQHIPHPPNSHNHNHNHSHIINHNNNHNNTRISTSPTKQHNNLSNSHSLKRVTSNHLGQRDKEYEKGWSAHAGTATFVIS